MTTPDPALSTSADVEAGSAVEALGEEYDECWVYRTSEITCAALIGATFPNGGEWTAEMCCLPCRLRAALAQDAARTPRGGALSEDALAFWFHDEFWRASACIHPNNSPWQCVAWAGRLTAYLTSRATRPAPDDQAEGEVWSTAHAKFCEMGAVCSAHQPGDWVGLAAHIGAAARAAQPDADAP